MTIPAREPPEFVPGSVVEVAADDPADDLHAGERGTVLVGDPNDDLHILWDSGDINIWTVPDARASLRVNPVLKRRSAAVGPDTGPFAPRSPP